ncbi:MAG: DUF3299 domain-containing protein [Rhizobiaceae bacterium]
MKISRPRPWILTVLGCVLLTVSLSGPLGAVTTTEISWRDLVPGNSVQKFMESPMGTVQHGELSTPVPKETAANVTNKYNGKTIRIAGYIVPLEFDSDKVKKFLLVPYVGACIHVPPPPANQLIYVTSDKAHKLKGLFEPVYVTGVLGAAASSTELAEVGYALTAETIEPYE